MYNYNDLTSGSSETYQFFDALEREQMRLEALASKYRYLDVCLNTILHTLGTVPEAVFKAIADEYLSKDNTQSVLAIARQYYPDL